MDATKDSDLVRAASKGDADAFGRLVERHRDAVDGLAYRHLGSFEDPCDTVQERFVEAYLKLSELRAQEKFGSWLRQIAANEGKSWQRRKSGRRNPGGAPAEAGLAPADGNLERLAASLTVQRRGGALSAARVASR